MCQQNCIKCEEAVRNALLKATTPSIPEEDRLHMIHPFQEGIRQRDIAKATGRPLCTVNRILQAFHDEGRIENLLRGRRPRATTSEQDMLIVAAAAVKPSLTSKQIKCEFDLSASTKTVRRRLHNVRLRNCVPARKPKQSETNKLARLLFAEDHATWTAEDWSCVLLANESTFSSRWDQRQRISRAVNTRYE
ncbi:hypothetical protein HPB48_009074 [Haemaphysalis longicornis]|uniref:Transposase Tc1-like domain-containing protein n=1 Tax=Haemaphysalis longicornis TaxID=44386 RepID=A0A9J6FYI6_HAELO|nr:hypothetical protein HPB48_009074 [Haemaphysalis longicornis]